MTFLLRGRRSIWWGCKVMPVAPRIVDDVSYVMRINHDIPFAWQAQYLVRLEGDSCRSAHSKWRFICDADQSWHSFCVAGAVFGEVGGRFLSSHWHGIWVFQMYLGVSNWLDHWPKSHPPTHWNHGGVGRTINYTQIQITRQHQIPPCHPCGHFFEVQLLEQALFFVRMKCQPFLCWVGFTISSLMLPHWQLF